MEDWKSQLGKVFKFAQFRVYLRGGAIDDKLPSVSAASSSSISSSSWAKGATVAGIGGIPGGTGGSLLILALMADRYRSDIVVYK